MINSTNFSAHRIAIGATALITFFVFASASAADAPKGWKLPRTPDGRPDLQGIWTNATITPVERDPKYGDHLALTAKEAAEVENANADFRAEADKPTDPTHGIQDLPKDCGGGFTGTNCGYNNFWIDSGERLITINGEKRSSIITDPPNGRVPTLTPAGREIMAKLYASFRSGGADGPEVRALGERCLLSFDSSSGPPMLPLLYNNNYQIVQTPTEIKILVEMVHDVRTIRIGGQHLPSNIRLWMGDSIGRWEGDTLIVETTNFRSEQFFRGSSPDAVFEWQVADAVGISLIAGNVVDRRIQNTRGYDQLLLVARRVNENIRVWKRAATREQMRLTPAVFDDFFCIARTQGHVHRTVSRMNVPDFSCCLFGCRSSDLGFEQRKRFIAFLEDAESFAQ